MSEAVLAEALARSRERSLNPMQLLSYIGQLGSVGDSKGVLELYRTWLEHNADNPISYAMYFNYGAVLSQVGDVEAAKTALSEAIRLNPTFLPPYINLGHVYERLGQPGVGVQQWYAVAEILKQITGEAIGYKIAALKQIGRVLELYQIDENAEDALRLGLDINPDQSDVIQHWVSLRQRQCKWPVIAPFGTMKKEQFLKGISALSLAAHTDDPLMQLANAAAYAKHTIGRPSKTYTQLHDRLLRKPANQRRKVGYLSSDLREHAIGYLTAELYELHDRSKVEVYLYYCGHKVKDAMHQRIKASAEHWVDLDGMSDEQAAERIFADEIEILIDVNGYTHSARAKTLAMRPAPIIVNWLGFPGSLGNPSHNYIIADEFIIPRESEVYYSEKVLRIPCYQPNDRKRVIADRTPTRTEVGLPEDAMVFCCFNGVHKITPFTWARWMAVLKMVPNSVLWLLESIESVSKRLKEHAVAAGVDPARIIFAKKARNPDHLARYPLADLFLDTSPYGAHTTSSDALWMGVPVLTLTGRSFASRVCGSLLKSAGLPELICSTPEKYVSLAVELGTNREKLSAIRNKLKAQRDTCVLFNTPLLAASLESIYEQMWTDFRHGRLPRPTLTNMEVYNDIGCEIADNNVELLTIPNYQDLYRQKLAERHAYESLPADQRLWTGVAPAVTAPIPTPAKMPTAEELYQAAAKEVGRGQIAEAGNLLARALSIDSKNHNILDLAARVAMMQGKLDLAETLARQAIKISPVVNIGLTLAEVMKAKGNHKNAANFFLSVLETQPTDTRARIGLAEIYEAAGQRASAASMFEQALAADPKNLPLAIRYVGLLKAAELPRGLSALQLAKPDSNAPLNLQLGYYNQYTLYKEWAERAAHGLMPYHATSLSELFFNFAAAERDAYDSVATAILTQNPNDRDATGAKAVCALTRGQRGESEALFKKIAAAMPGSIYEAITFSNDLFRRLEAMGDAELVQGLPIFTTVAAPDFADQPIIYFSCNYGYFADFTRPMLMSINDVAPGAQIHLHIMDAPEGGLETVKALCASLPAVKIAISAESPGLADKDIMIGRCYYHAIRFIRLYQHLIQYGQPLWMMDVDGLMHRDPAPMFARMGEADVAFRARPGRWEPWNQFNASVVGFSPTPRSISYLRLIAAFIANSYRAGRLRWGIDQLAMYSVHEYLRDEGRAPSVHLLNDREVDYDYYDDGFVWGNSGKGKFAQLEIPPAKPGVVEDSHKVRYFEALRRYLAKQP